MTSQENTERLDRLDLLWRDDLTKTYAARLAEINEQLRALTDEGN